MQGISTSKHQHLVDALLHLEKLLGEDFVQDADRQRSTELRQKLETLLTGWPTLLRLKAELH